MVQNLKGVIILPIRHIWILDLLFSAIFWWLFKKCSTRTAKAIRKRTSVWATKVL